MCQFTILLLEITKNKTTNQGDQVGLHKDHQMQMDRYDIIVELLPGELVKKHHNSQAKS